ncbi:hypothetical protein GCM10008096_21080 [Zhihengliuella salsuginis]|uniref:Uncharacterized protein n=1 Tax=Zhihengliuella salsuginis TaxID=578222 RepID=A0ABQ3GKF6_9MICC|nr:hypothetical protein GCM10008096_21080 [Zhihengliuella salsuginis]
MSAQEVRSAGGSTDSVGVGSVALMTVTLDAATGRNRRRGAVGSEAGFGGVSTIAAA